MTVQELINRLETVKDKSVNVMIGCEGYIANPKIEEEDFMGIRLLETNDGVLICDDCYYSIAEKEI